MQSSAETKSGIRVSEVHGLINKTLSLDKIYHFMGEDFKPVTFPSEGNWIFSFMFYNFLTNVMVPRSFDTVSVSFDYDGYKCSIDPGLFLNSFTIMYRFPIYRSDRSKVKSIIKYFLGKYDFFIAHSEVGDNDVEFYIKIRLNIYDHIVKSLTELNDMMVNYGSDRVPVNVVRKLYIFALNLSKNIDRYIKVMPSFTDNLVKIVKMINGWKL